MHPEQESVKAELTPMKELQQLKETIKKERQEVEKAVEEMSKAPLREIMEFSKNEDHAIAQKLGLEEDLTLDLDLGKERKKLKSLLQENKETLEKQQVLYKEIEKTFKPLEHIEKLGAVTGNLAPQDFDFVGQTVYPTPEEAFNKLDEKPLKESLTVLGRSALKAKARPFIGLPERAKLTEQTEAFHKSGTLFNSKETVRGVFKALKDRSFTEQLDLFRFDNDKLIQKVLLYLEVFELDQNFQDSESLEEFVAVVLLVNKLFAVSKVDKRKQSFERNMGLDINSYRKLSGSEPKMVARGFKRIDVDEDDEDMDEVKPRLLKEVKGRLIPNRIKYGEF